jgi:hypothetical protein
MVVIVVAQGLFRSGNSRYGSDKLADISLIDCRREGRKCGPNNFDKGNKFFQ